MTDKLQAEKTNMSKRIAGALIYFFAYLTTREETLTLGAEHLTPPAVEALKEWADKRGLSLDGADVENWDK